MRIINHAHHLYSVCALEAFVKADAEGKSGVECTALMRLNSTFDEGPIEHAERCHRAPIDPQVRRSLEMKAHEIMQRHGLA